MGYNVETNTIDRELRRMASAFPKVRNKALRESAPIIAKGLKSNTPKDNRTRDGKWKSQRKFEKATGAKTPNYPHLKDDIEVSGVDSNGEIRIGFGKKTYWRAHFVETGTIKQKGQNFVKRTEKEVSAAALLSVSRKVIKGLNL